ncbi:MAG: hypothetical protein ABSC06_39250 [Rhodopila sp.]
MTHVLTMKTLIRAGFMALSLGSISAAYSETAPFHAPAHNFYQNNWMTSD